MFSPDLLVRVQFKRLAQQTHRYASYQLSRDPTGELIIDSTATVIKPIPSNIQLSLPMMAHQVIQKYAIAYVATKVSLTLCQVPRTVQ